MSGKRGAQNSLVREQNSRCSYRKAALGKNRAPTAGSRIESDWGGRASLGSRAEPQRTASRSYVTAGWHPGWHDPPVGVISKSTGSMIAHELNVARSVEVVARPAAAPLFCSIHV